MVAGFAGGATRDSMSEEKDTSPQDDAPAGETRRCISCLSGDLSRFHGQLPAWLMKAVRCLQPCNDPRLHRAIREDDRVALAELLDSRRCFGLSRTNVNVALDGADGSALHVACSVSSESLVHALLKRGAHVNATDASGEVALHIAARRGDPSILCAILASNCVRLDALNKFRHSPLMLAVCAKHWGCARLLLQAGALAWPLGSADTDTTAALCLADVALSTCMSLWPSPTVRYCAVGLLGRDEPLASCAPQSAPSNWAKEISSLESRRGAEMLRRVMVSNRIKDHPKLTVSTESGMLHYELQPESQLLFLTITLKDTPQSTAFDFLSQLRDGFMRTFDEDLSLRSYDQIAVKASCLLHSLCDGCHPDWPSSVTSSPCTPRACDVLVHEARLLHLHNDGGLGPAVSESPVMAAVFAPSVSTFMSSMLPPSVDKWTAPNVDRPLLRQHDILDARSSMPCASTKASQFEIDKEFEENTALNGKVGDCTETTVVGMEGVAAYLASQLCAIAALLPHLTTSHAVLILRRFSWSYTDVMSALEQSPTLLADLFPSEAAQIASMPLSASGATELLGHVSIPANPKGSSHALPSGECGPVEDDEAYAVASTRPFCAEKLLDEESTAARLQVTASMQMKSCEAIQDDGKTNLADNSFAATAASDAVHDSSSLRLGKPLMYKAGAAAMDGNGENTTSIDLERATEREGGGFEAWSDAKMQAYLRAQVLGGSMPLTYPLPSDLNGHKLRMLPQPVPPQVMQRLLTPELLRAYEDSLLRCFINESDSWQVCPRPGCNHVIHRCQTAQVRGRPAFDTMCACSHRFCWKCRRDPHEPLPCAMLSAWQMACAEQEEEGEEFSRQKYPPEKMLQRGTKDVTSSSGLDVVSGTHGADTFSGPGARDNIARVEAAASAELRACRSLIDCLNLRLEQEAVWRENLSHVGAIMTLCYGAPGGRESEATEWITGSLSSALTAFIDGTRALRASHIARHLTLQAQLMAAVGCDGKSVSKGTSNDIDELVLDPSNAAQLEGISMPAQGARNMELAVFMLTQKQLAHLLDRLNDILAVPLPEELQATSDLCRAKLSGNEAEAAEDGKSCHNLAGQLLHRCSGARVIALLQYAAMLRRGKNEIAILTAATRAKHQQLHVATRRLVQAQTRAQGEHQCVAGAPAAMNEADAGTWMAWLQHRLTTKRTS